MTPPFWLQLRRNSVHKLSGQLSKSEQLQDKTWIDMIRLLKRRTRTTLSQTRARRAYCSWLPNTPCPTVQHLHSLIRSDTSTGIGFWKENQKTNKLMCYPQQFGRFWKVCGYLPRNSPESYQPSAPEPSGTSSAICTTTVRNLPSYLHRNPQQSAPDSSGTSSEICTRTLRNPLSHLHRNPPEPSPEHRIAPYLFWAKDPIASFAVGEKNKYKTA